MIWWFFVYLHGQAICAQWFNVPMLTCCPLKRTDFWFVTIYDELDTFDLYFVQVHENLWGWKKTSAIFLICFDHINSFHMIILCFFTVWIKCNIERGPRDYLDVSLLDIFGKSVPIRNFKKYHLNISKDIQFSKVPRLWPKKWAFYVHFNFEMKLSISQLILQLGPSPFRLK